MTTSEIQNLVVRPPRSDEIQLLRRVIPGAFRGRPQAQLWVAAGEVPELILGAAALRILPDSERPEAGRFGLQVRPTHRRRGVGSALLYKIIEEAKKAGAPRLAIAGTVVESSPAHALLKGKGFETSQRGFLFEASIAGLLAVLEPAYERMKKRKQFPKDAELIRLGEASQDQVRELVLKNLGGQPRALALRLLGGQQGFTQKNSVVLTLKSNVIGAVLVRFVEKKAIIDAIAVAPEYRNRWAHLALKRQVLENLKAAGYTTIFFRANEQAHRDTARFAGRAEAKKLETRCAMVLKL